jgi:MFS family permease
LPDNSPRSPIRPLPLIIILMVLDHVAFNGGRVTVTLFAIKQGATPMTVGMLLATYALLPALLSVTAGRWMDRVGLWKPLLLGSVFVGIGMLVPFVFPSIWALYVTSIVVGVSFMLINVAAYHAVGELSTAEDRAVNFSYVSLGFSTSSFIAPVLSGVGIDNFGHRATFLLLALFTVLPVIALAFRVIPFPQPQPRPHEAGKGVVFDLLRDTALRRLFITMAILTVAWDVYAFAIPVHGSHIGLSASEIGIVMGTFAAATFAVRLAIPFVVNRIRPWSMLTGSLLVAGLSFAGLSFAQNVGVMMMLVFCLGMGLGAPQPMVLTLLHESAPPGRAGEALGLRTTLINGSQTVMPLIFGVVGAALGMLPLFWTIGAALLGGSFFARRIGRQSSGPGAANG